MHLPVRLSLSFPCKTIAPSLLAALLTQTAFASQPEPDPVTIPVQVLEAAQAYQETVACAIIDKAKQPVVALTPYTDSKHRSEVRYAVLWSGDAGCTGHPDAVTAQLTILGMDDNNRFVVDTAHSSPNVIFDAPVSVVDSVVNATQNTLTLRGKDYAEDDKPCCPSVNTRFTLREDNKGNWLLIEQYSEPQDKKPAHPASVNATDARKQ